MNEIEMPGTENIQTVSKENSSSAAKFWSRILEDKKPEPARLVHIELPPKYWEWKIYRSGS